MKILILLFISISVIGVKVIFVELWFLRKYLCSKNADLLFSPYKEDSLNLKNAVESQKSMQATNAPSQFKKLLITNKVTTHFLNSLGFSFLRRPNFYIPVGVCTSLSCMSFLRLNAFSRLKNLRRVRIRCYFVNDKNNSGSFSGKRITWSMTVYCAPKISFT